MSFVLFITSLICHTFSLENKKLAYEYVTIKTH